MAKAPKEEMISRVRIHAETTVPEMGPLLVRLTMMGLENIGYELITDVKGFGRGSFETTGRELMIEYIKEHPTFSIKEAVKHFRAHGRTNSSAYTSAKVLTEDGVLKRLGDGNYASADVKHIAGPSLKDARALGPTEIILRHIKNRKSFTTKELVVLFRAHELAPHSVHTTLNRLKNQRQIRSLGEGKYEPVNKKGPAKKGPAKKGPAKKPAAKKPAKRVAVEPAPQLNEEPTPQETNHA